jgi:calcium-dependent protein kinase
MVMAYIANYLQSKENEKKLSTAFKEFDKNGDGLLERNELIEGYVKLGMAKEDAVVEVDEIMKNIDINHDGNIQYSEFIMANLNKEEALSDKKLKEAFNIFDKVFNCD